MLIFPPNLLGTHSFTSTVCCLLDIVLQSCCTALMSCFYSVPQFFRVFTISILYISCLYRFTRNTKISCCDQSTLTRTIASLAIDYVHCTATCVYVILRIILHLRDIVLVPTWEYSSRIFLGSQSFPPPDEPPMIWSLMNSINFL